MKIITDLVEATKTPGKCEVEICFCGSLAEEYMCHISDGKNTMSFVEMIKEKYNQQLLAIVNDGRIEMGKVCDIGRFGGDW